MNRYIKAMEIGLANEDKGISYFELITQINEYSGKKMSIEGEVTYYRWFNDNFVQSGMDLEYEIS